MRFLKWVGIAILVFVFVVGLAFVAARFADGPLGMIPGGPFTTGEWVDEPVADWAFVSDLETIEMELLGSEASRTTWIVSYGDDAYIPASLKFPPGKSWHLKADEDGRAVLRIDGRRYRVNLRRLKDPERTAAVGEVLVEKYSPPPGGRDDVWIFEVTSRAE